MDTTIHFPVIAAFNFVKFRNHSVSNVIATDIIAIIHNYYHIPMVVN